MRELELDHSMPHHQLASSLRCLFSGIVAGNIKEDAIRDIEDYGPFEIKGERKMLKNLDLYLTPSAKTRA